MSAAAVALVCFLAALVLVLSSVTLEDAERGWRVFLLGVALNVAGWAIYFAWVAS